MKVITRCFFLAIILLAFNTSIADTTFEGDTTGEYVEQSVNIAHDEVAVVPASVEDIRSALYMICGLIAFLMLIAVLAIQIPGPEKKQE